MLCKKKKIKKNNLILNKMYRLYRCSQMLPSSLCDCGVNYQPIDHIISDCPILAFQGNKKDFLLPSPETNQWIENLDIDL